jgi:uncharacterized damage-inducible protein DinB
MEWADACVWKAVLGSEAASRNEGIRLWFHHLHAVQRAFLAAWRREEPVLPEQEDTAEAVAIAAWGKQAHVGIQAFLEAVTPERLAETLRVPWAGMVEKAWKIEIEAPTVRETALQVFLHTAHHRAQINARLREAGTEPPAIDYIIWLWRARPSPDWSFLGM